MKILMSLVNRNRKLFFRDKGMLVSAMITPIILIVLYATFLAKVYRDSFLSNMPETLPISDKLINGTVAGQLAAALLAVSCVTVTFCVNLTMVQDRVYGSRRDFDVSPVRKPMIYLGYFFSTVLNSLMVNMVALAACFVYVWKMGWFLRAGYVAFLIVHSCPFFILILSVYFMLFSSVFVGLRIVLLWGICENTVNYDVHYITREAAVQCQILLFDNTSGLIFIQPAFLLHHVHLHSLYHQ